MGKSELHFATIPGRTELWTNFNKHNFSLFNSSDFIFAIGWSSVPRYFKLILSPTGITVFGSSVTVAMTTFPTGLKIAG